MATGVEMNAEGSAQGFGVKIKHGPSGTILLTEPPADNGGTGAAFSPTDLVGAALASCAMTTMALAAKREGVSWGATSARVEKRMNPSPRRIGELVIELRMPKELAPDQRQRFEEIARNCPVARSLSPDVKVPIVFKY